MLWEGRPQLKDVVGWFLDNSSFSKMQNRRLGRVGAVASDGHEHPSLALPLGSFSPKTHEKMAFTVTSSFSRRPIAIASTGGPLALLYLLRDGKICLEISTCRLAPFTRDSLCTCLQLEDREPYAGLGHADYAMAWDRSMPVCHCSVTNSNDTWPTYVCSRSFEMGIAKSSVSFSQPQLSYCLKGMTNHQSAHQEYVQLILCSNLLILSRYWWRIVLEHQD